MGLLFAGLSYLFWFIAVALVGGYIGYGLVVGLFGLFSVELGPLVWILGVAAGVIFAVATLMLNLQKYVVIIGSAMLGGAAIVGTILTVLNQVDPSVMADHPVKVVTDAGFGWSLLFLGVAVVARCTSSQARGTTRSSGTTAGRSTTPSTAASPRRSAPRILVAYHRGARATGLRGRHNAPATREPDPGNAGGGSRWFAPRSSFVREDPYALRCRHPIRVRSSSRPTPA